MEPPTPVGRYLGCEHHLIDVEIQGPFQPRHAWIQQLEQEQRDKLKPPPDYTQGTTFLREKGGNSELRQDLPEDPQTENNRKQGQLGPVGTTLVVM